MILTRTVLLLGVALLGTAVGFIVVVERQRPIQSVDDMQAHERGDRFGLVCQPGDDSRSGLLDEFLADIGRVVDGDLARWRRTAAEELRAGLFKVSTAPSNDDAVKLGASVAEIECVDATEVALREVYAAGVRCRNLGFTTAAVTALQHAVRVLSEKVRLASSFGSHRGGGVSNACMVAVNREILSFREQFTPDDPAEQTETGTPEAAYSQLDLSRLGRAVWDASLGEVRGSAR